MTQVGKVNRRTFLLKFFVSFVVLYGAFCLIPRKWHMWLVSGRRLESERKVLNSTVSNLPPTTTFPCGEEKARVVVVRNQNLFWEQEEYFAPSRLAGHEREEQDPDPG